MIPKNIPPPLSWGLCILGCMVFIGAKWQDLSLPMYWDEIGVYGPGILYMVDHGISMLPSGLDPELSRGHPLFFYFLFAAWEKIVGYSLVKLHVFALAISLGLFASVFHISRKLTAEIPALLMTFWLMAQGAVFAQASLALPEMLLSLEILWALYFFYRKKLSPLYSNSNTRLVDKRICFGASDCLYLLASLVIYSKKGTYYRQGNPYCS